jgi:hypothetical protein
VGILNQRNLDVSTQAKEQQIYIDQLTNTIKDLTSKQSAQEAIKQEQEDSYLKETQALHQTINALQHQNIEKDHLVDVMRSTVESLKQQVSEQDRLLSVTQLELQANTETQLSLQEKLTQEANEKQSLNNSVIELKIEYQNVLNELQQKESLLTQAQLQNQSATKDISAINAEKLLREEQVNELTQELQSSKLELISLKDNNRKHSEGICMQSLLFMF